MPTRPNLSRLLTKAWMTAKLAARRFGGSPRVYIAETMRQAWLAEKAVIKSCNEMAERVRAEVAAIIAMPRPAPVPFRFHQGARRRYGRVAA